MTSPLELLVVVPVYNEREAIGGVVADWCAQFDALGIRYLILALDDGSTDDTPAVLQALAEKWEPKLEVMRQTNMGHGQTALKGYRIGAERNVPWVFQIDSDGQCDPQYFPELWQSREGYDIVTGFRTSRNDGFRRVVVSFVLRCFNRILFGADCRDSNVPYRLMRTASIEPLVKKIPRSFHLANIGLAVLAARAGLRHKYIPIGFRARHGGEPAVPFHKFGNRAIELYKNMKDLLKE